jgi:hypothetical protein
MDMAYKTRLRRMCQGSKQA